MQQAPAVDPAVRPMRYSIPRYPVHLIDVMQAPDARRIVIRPALPQDTELLRNYFRGLSAASRYRRFMARINEAPESVISTFACADHSGHLALLAEVFEDGREVMVAEARYAVADDDPATCEMAISVTDAWQQRGIGRGLLDRLQRQAAASGIRRMLAETLMANDAMMGLARQAGFAIRAGSRDASVAMLEKVLLPPQPGAV